MYWSHYLHKSLIYTMESCLTQILQRKDEKKVNLHPSHHSWNNLPLTFNSRGRHHVENFNLPYLHAYFRRVLNVTQNSSRSFSQFHNISSDNQHSHIYPHIPLWRTLVNTNDNHNRLCLAKNKNPLIVQNHPNEQGSLNVLSSSVLARVSSSSRQLSI